MKDFARYLGVPTITALLSMHLAYAQTPMDFRKVCPSSKPQQLKFESTVVNVDSVSSLISNGRSEIVNCVQIVDAKHEYYVDLVGTNLSNVWTQSGGYLAQNDPFVTRETEYDPTLLYLGSNRDQYDVKILKEKSKLAVVVDSVVTWLIASLPTRRDKPQDSLQPVVLHFEATDKGDTVELAFTDVEAHGPPLSFRIPPSVGHDVGGRNYRIGKETTRIRYQTGSGPKLIWPTKIEFIDSDGRGLAAMQVYLLAPAATQR